MMYNYWLKQRCGQAALLTIFLIGGFGVLKAQITGNGTSGDPYQISNAAALIDAQSRSSSAYYELTADINATSVPNSFSGIGNNPSFTGNFNGNGFVISNLIINLPSTDRVGGLFRSLGNGAAVSNVGLENIDITGQNNVGGLAGEAEPGVGLGSLTVENVFVTGAITGSGNATSDTCVGGLIGDVRNASIIAECYTDVTVSATGYQFVGGFAGRLANASTSVTSSYARGAVTGNDMVGGFVGSIDSASTTLRRNYAAVTVLGDTNTGEFTGWMPSTTGNFAYNFFYDDAGDAGQGTNSAAIGLTEAEMQDGTSFTNFDFATVWAINPEVNNGYPYLRDAPGAPTIWDGIDWSNDIPDGDATAIISSGIPGYASFEARNIIVEDGATLTVESGETVTVGLNLYNYGTVTGTGTLTFDATASGNDAYIWEDSIAFEGVVDVKTGTELYTNNKLVLTASSSTAYGMIIGDGIVADNIYVQAWLDLAGTGNDGRWYHLGSPVTSAFLSDFGDEDGSIFISADDNTGTVWEWNAQDASWEPANNADINTTAPSGKGYTIYAGTNSAGTFLRNGPGTIMVSGSPTARNDTTAVYYNNGAAATVGFAGGTDEEDTEGWNLLANPYPAQIDWEVQDEILPGSSQAYYVYNGTNYSSYINGASQAIDAGPASAGRYIAPFQAFWYQLSGPSEVGDFVFDENARTTGESAELFKANPVALDGINLNVSANNATAHDGLYIGFDNNSTVNFDHDWDARKLLNDAAVPNLYTRLGRQSYSICRVPNSSLWSFPIFLEYAVDGDQMTISADLDELKSFGKVELEDLKTGIKHDLTSGGYLFTYDASHGSSRFIVHFSESSIGLEEPKAENKKALVFAYAIDNGLGVNLGTVHNAKVELYNLAGQKMMEVENANGIVKLPVKQHGAFIVRVEGADNFTSSIKVIR